MTNKEKKIKVNTRVVIAGGDYQGQDGVFIKKGALRSLVRMRLSGTYEMIRNELIEKYEY